MKRPTLFRMRRELQKHLVVSVDELAVMLGLSPTTVINATKSNARTRPTTIRAFMRLYYRTFPEQMTVLERQDHGLRFGDDIALKIKPGAPIGKARRL